jgi:hypothetical protein
MDGFCGPQEYVNSILLANLEESWGVRGDFESHSAQKERLITAHIIGHRLHKPSSSQSLAIARPVLPTPPLGVEPALSRRKASRNWDECLLPT